MKDPEAAPLGPRGRLRKSRAPGSSSLAKRGCRECWGQVEAWGWQKTPPWAETLRPGQMAGTGPLSQSPLQIPLYLQALEFLSILNSFSDIIQCHGFKHFPHTTNLNRMSPLFALP